MRRLFLCLAIIAAFSFSPSGAQAADCTCFCATPEGAQNDASATNGGDCAKACTDAGNAFLVCATDPSAFPGQNPVCFDEETCVNQNGEWALEQSPECPSGMRYCYPADESPAILSTAIEGVTEVEDYGELIQLIYRAGLSMAVIIAIVFVMIGGLQYVLAAGTGNVEKAKARIRNAVAGLVLLLCVFIILYTVNPRLVLLDPPKFPKVRRVEFVKEQSCEYLAGLEPFRPPYLDISPYWEDPYELGTKCAQEPCPGEQEPGPYGEDRCGSIDTVLKTPDGGDVPDGTTCQYIFCDDPGSICLGEGMDAKCVKCTEIKAGGVAGLTPSSDICSAATSPFSGGAGDKGYSECFFTRDPGAIIDGWTFTEGVSAPYNYATSESYEEYLSTQTSYQISVGLCAEVNFNCNDVQTQSCRGYDEVTITSAETSNQLDDLWFDNSGIGSVFASPVNLETICSADPCGFGAAAGGRCVTLQPEVDIWGVTIWDAYGCYTFKDGAITDGESGVSGVLEGWFYN